MLKENELIGAISIYRREVRPFTENRSHLSRISPPKQSSPSRTRGCSTNCASAPLTSPNAQQTSRKRWSSRRPRPRCSRSYQSSPGDLQPVFATMLEKAVRICDATFGNICRWDGEALHLVATHNTPPAFAEARRRLTIRLGPTGPVGQHDGEQNGSSHRRSCSRTGLH